MTKTIKRYSEAFRRQVVKEYEAGCTLSDLQKKYGIIGNSTIQRWVHKYSYQGLREATIRVQTAEEANRVRELEQQVETLERALARTMLEKLKLESMVEELQQLHGADLVKKNAVPSSPVSGTSARSKATSK